jgi:hypothetical protein
VLPLNVSHLLTHLPRNNIMKWIPILILLSLSSCQKEKLCSSSVKISFVNSTTTPSRLIISNGLDSVDIFARSYSVVGTELCFRENLNSDGSYKLKFSSSTKDTSFTFGYFTNGVPLDEEIQVSWANDSLYLKSIPK